MADLNAILSQYGPNSVLGGAMAGMAFSDYSKAQDQARQKESLEMALKQAEENRRVEEHPLNLESKRATIGQTNAQTRNFSAQATGHELANSFTQATQPSKIDADISANNASSVESKIKAASAQASVFGQIAAGVSANSKALIGPGALQNYVLSQAQQFGLSIDNPVLQTALKTYQDPKTLVEALSKYSQYINTTSAAYQKAQMEKEATRYTADQHLAGVKYAADVGAKSRLDVASVKNKASDLYTNVLSGKVPPDRALAAAQFAEQMATTDEEKAVYKELSARMQTIINNSAAAQANNNKPDIGQIQSGVITKPQQPNPYKDTTGQTSSGVKFKVVPPSTK